MNFSNELLGILSFVSVTASIVLWMLIFWISLLIIPPIIKIPDVTINEWLGASMMMSSQTIYTHGCLPLLPVGHCMLLTRCLCYVHKKKNNTTLRKSVLFQKSAQHKEVTDPNSHWQRRSFRLDCFCNIYYQRYLEFLISK